MNDLPSFPYRDRRNTALARMRDGAMVLPAAQVRFKNSDSEYRYRPDSELLYMTGWDVPGCVTLLRGFADKQRFVMFVPERDEIQELWTGPRPDLQEVKSVFGADAVYPMRDLEARAPEMLVDGETVYYRLGGSDECDRVVRKALTGGRGRRARRGAGAQSVTDPGAVLDEMRLRKDRAEVARLRQAAGISAAAFREGLAIAAEGAREYEVEAVLEAEFRCRGADGAAFATIVAAGPNGCTLHYTANTSRIAPGDLVLVDAGAECAGYAGDITRTVPASGRFEEPQRDVYEIVLRAHAAGLGACRPGASLDDVHDAAVRQIAEGLLGLGVVAGSVDGVIESQSYRPYFPHRTSHWLGLDTHDVGPYRDANGPVRLEAGMVFTVEPGLYFRPGSCRQAPALEGIAVRIEDDVLIHKRGAEVLTKTLPVEAGAVADLVRP